MLVREVLVTEVEVGLRRSSGSVRRFSGGSKYGYHGLTDVSDDAESGGEFVLFGFWEYGTHYVI